MIAGMRPVIETMDQHGVAEALAWAESEGWQPGLGDEASFFAADPAGFLRSVEGDRTVATISVVRGSESVAFVGLYIVAPEFRGQGFGKALWDEALSRFDGFTLGLDAVPAQVDTYASDGFVPAFGNARYSIDAEMLPDPDPAVEIVPASSVAFEDLAAFDGDHFLGPRPDFLRSWIAGEGRAAVVTVSEDGITGFAASRATSAGHRIGPVFTADPDLARNLILCLAKDMSGPVAIDIPQPNSAAVGLLEGFGMERSFETTRMYRGLAPELPLDEIFGITTLELG